MEKIKTALSYLSCGVIAAFFVAWGLLLRDSLPIIAVMASIMALAVLCGACLMPWLSRRTGVPVSRMLVGWLPVDVLLMVMYVQVYADDLQEEWWHPLAVVVCLWAFVDFMRCVLRNVNDGSYMADDRNDMVPVSDASGMDARATMPISRYGNSRALKVRIFVWGVVCWAALMYYFYLKYGFDTDFVINAVWFLCVYIGLASLVAFGTRMSVGRDSVVVNNNGSFGRKTLVRYGEISRVVVDRSLLYGERMTFHYGNGRHVVAYPAHIDAVVATLRRRHVCVEMRLGGDK